MRKTIGYPGINKIIKLIIRDFTWSKLRNNIEKYIKEYDIYVKSKLSRRKLYELLQSILTPEKV